MVIFKRALTHVVYQCVGIMFGIIINQPKRHHSTQTFDYRQKKKYKLLKKKNNTNNNHYSECVNL